MHYQLNSSSDNFVIHISNVARFRDAEYFSCIQNGYVMSSIKDTHTQYEKLIRVGMVEQVKKSKVFFKPVSIHKSDNI